MEQLTETVVIRLDLYEELITLMACARILLADPTSGGAREWTAKSLNHLASPTLYNPPSDTEPV